MGYIVTFETSHPRNLSRESQQISLKLALTQANVPFQTLATRRHPIKTLWLAPAKGETTLPFVESCADLVHVAPRNWEARRPFDGRVLATGTSFIDVIRASVQKVCLQ